MFRSSIVLFNKFRYIDPSFIPQTIRIAPEEYQWVNDVVSTSRKFPLMETAILEWKPYHKIPTEILQHTSTDSHSRGSILWTMIVAQEIIRTRSQIVPVQTGGIEYNPF